MKGNPCIPIIVNLPRHVLYGSGGEKREIGWKEMTDKNGGREQRESGRKEMTDKNGGAQKK